MTDADALLASILDRPEDDLPRLVFADWLDEQGNESDAARAAFIRVQCELAKHPPTITPGNRCPKCNDPGHWRRGVGFDHEKRCPKCELVWEPGGEAIPNPATEELRGRERELWNASRLNGAPHPWVPVPKGFRGTTNWLSTHNDPVISTTHRGEKIEFRLVRGFPSAVRLPLAEFMGGGRCESCWVGEDGHAMRLVSDCPFCNGTGRTDGIAKRLFESQPVAMVEFTDREPVESVPGRWLLPSGLPEPMMSLILTKYGFAHSTRDLATIALSNAAVRLGRSLANLRPLEPVA